MQSRKPILEPLSPADLFISRYKWLLRWAMQFSRNDRNAAEDLMQDTFLRFSQASFKVAEVRDVEALLYTYLEHVYLAHMRELTRHSFVSLADAKLDALALQLLSGPDIERTESQNVLRRIAAYVAWRKQTSKAASIVALRFFHGFLPEEIARIALVSREAVDERLHSGRNEIRLHLADAAKVREMQHGGPAEIFPSQVGVSTDDLLMELRNQLFLSSHGECTSSDQLSMRYRKMSDMPIPRDLLAHIVSCPRCLAVAEQIALRNQPPRTSGKGGNLIGMQGRKSSKESPSISKQIETTVSRAERRRREIYEHRPTALIVAVNGELIASRDIRASFNGLKVEIPTHDLKFIDVLNEHGVPLFSWASLSAPPHEQPVTYRQTDFSMGRWLGVSLQFAVQKVVIEIEYHDACFQETLAPSFASLLVDDSTEDEPLTSHSEKPSGWKVELKKRLQAKLRWIQPSPLVATAVVSALLCAGLGLFLSRSSTSTKPEDLLRRAAASEQNRLSSVPAGVVVQEISIRSRQGAFDRSIYHDVAGKRHPKEQVLDKNQTRLRERLTDAGVNWDAPLSASSFQAWQSHARVKSESLRKINSEFLKLQVDSEGSDIEQETLTIRTLDLHPVERTVQLHDVGTIDIAEVSYAVIPWSLMNQDLFVSDSTRSSALTRAQPRANAKPPSKISDTELDLAELQVRSALHDMHADDTDRLSINRSASSVDLHGLVENDQQQSEIKHRLALIPHVSSDITTLKAASEIPETIASPAGVRLSSVVAAPSTLEVFLLNNGKTREFSNELSARFFSESVAMLRSDKALSQLRERFPPEKLSNDSLELYNRLLVSWYNELNTALAEESKAIQQTGISVSSDVTATPAPSSLNDAIQHNRSLLNELIGQDSAHTRTAQAVLSDLSHSVESIQEAANTERKRTSRTPSVETPSAIDNHP